MIDSSPCQKPIPTKMEEISYPQLSNLPTSDVKPSGSIISYLKSTTLGETASNKKEEFNFNISGINFYVHLEKSNSNNLEYSKDESTVTINIRSIHEYNLSSLKFICHYILLFDEANPILNKPKDFLTSILPS